MNYVPHFNLLGVEAKQIPCITGEGAPTTSTEGAVGCFYMDTTNGKMYKCTNVADGIYTWDLAVGEIAEFVVADSVINDLIDQTNYIHENSKIDTTSGDLKSDSRFSVSDYMDISNFDKLNLQIGKGTNTKFGCPPMYYYDENKIYIGQYNPGVNYEFEMVDELYTVPLEIVDGAVYVRFEIETVLIGSASREYHILGFNYIYEPKLKGNYYEKQMKRLCGYKANSEQIIVNMGDSLFGGFNDETSISYQLAELCGATVHNCGFGGCQMSLHSLEDFAPFSMCSLADAIASGDFSTQTEKANAGITGMPSYFIDHVNLLASIDFSTVDIITIAYGTNDWSANDTLDNTDNIYDVETIKGALRHSIETIGTAYPNIRFLICTPMWRCWFTNGVFQYDCETHTNGNGMKLVEYADAIKECAAEYHLPICDYYNEMGLNKFCWQVFFNNNNNDGTHPKEYGRYLMAKKLAEKLSAY